MSKSLGVVNLDELIDFISEYTETPVRHLPENELFEFIWRAPENAQRHNIFPWMEENAILLTDVYASQPIISNESFTCKQVLVGKKGDKVEVGREREGLILLLGDDMVVTIDKTQIELATNAEHVSETGIKSKIDTKKENKKDNDTDTKP